MKFSSSEGDVSRVQVIFSPQDRGGSALCVKDYVQTKANAEVTPVDHEGVKSLVFYWSNSGRVTITLYIRVMGRNETVSLNYVVHEPDVQLRATMGSARLTIKPFPGRDDNRNEDIVQFELGNSAGKPGIAFQAAVSFTNADVTFDGHIKMLQTFEANRQKNNVATGAVEVYEYDKPALDQALSYKHKCSAHEYKEQPVVAGQINLVTEDSPGSLMGRRAVFHADSPAGKEPYFTTARVDELYSMFLMYRPLNGIWVAIGQINWRWAGRVEISSVAAAAAVADTSVMTGNHGQNGRLRWTLSDLSTSCSNRSTVSTRLPTWETPDRSIEQDFDDDSGSEGDSSEDDDEVDRHASLSLSRASSSNSVSSGSSYGSSWGGKVD